MSLMSIVTSVTSSVTSSISSYMATPVTLTPIEEARVDVPIHCFHSAIPFPPASISPTGQCFPAESVTIKGESLIAVCKIIPWINPHGITTPPRTDIQVSYFPFNTSASLIPPAEDDVVIRIAPEDLLALNTDLEKLPIDSENSAGYAAATAILKEALAKIDDRHFEAAAEDKEMIAPIRALAVTACREITARLGFSLKMLKVTGGKVPSLTAHFQDHLDDLEKLKLKKIIAVTEGAWPLINLDT